MANLQTVRSFIAIELSDPLKKIVKNVQEQLKKSDADVKWVQPDHTHLTLKFLGDLSMGQVDSLIKELPRFLKKFPAFILELTELGAFPKPENPQIIWIGCRDEQDILSRLAECLEEELGSWGFAKERKKFIPHITIGRLRSFKNKPALSAGLRRCSVPLSVSQKITSIAFFKSTLTSHGPVYEILNKIELSPIP